MAATAAAPTGVEPMPANRRRRRLYTAAAAAGVVLCVVDLGWRPSGSSDALRFPGGQDFGISLPSTRAAQPYTIGSIFLCLDKGTTRATVDAVRPARDGGIAINAFGTRRDGVLFGAEQVTLAKAGFPAGGRTVTGSCRAEAGSELGVQLSKRGSGTGRLDGLLVSWHAGSTHGTTRVPIHFVLCADANQNVPDCLAMR